MLLRINLHQYSDGPAAARVLQRRPMGAPRNRPPTDFTYRRRNQVSCKAVEKNLRKVPEIAYALFFQAFRSQLPVE